LRHKAVKPRRSANGRRVYSEADVARLQRLHRLTAAGFSIGRIAHLSTNDLAELAAREAPEVEPRARAPGVAKPARFVAQAMAAVAQLDSDGLLRVLETADVALGKPAFLEHVVAIVADEVGAAWRSGRLKVAHEHFVTAQLRGYLGPFGRLLHGSADTPHLIVTTPAAQWHELGALLVAAAAHSYGWRVTYLGPSMPVEEIAGAALGYRARAVALSIVYPGDDPQLSRELTRLRRLLPERIAILIGGRSAHAYATTSREPGVHHLPALHDLYPELDRLRRKDAAGS
jgi:DNA-binding transcriptional MerR regulator/methylmalonyl-CoA mutase cobalamin-binding subunit